MESNAVIITVETLVNASLEKVWKIWTSPSDIIKWNTASEDWHTPTAENDLWEGGSFLYRMEAKDGSFGFDFSGVYNKIQELERIEYAMEDGRKVQIAFFPMGNQTKVVETFEAENENSPELQKTGWQAILNNFKAYTEAS
ncbi:MAG: SRPBCC family protein [Pyrinomonadaceae bacterium]|nr:SRPBCC family protein [Sphingobacteriaceae bacterium]